MEITKQLHPKVTKQPKHQLHVFQWKILLRWDMGKPQKPATGPLGYSMVTRNKPRTPSMIVRLPMVNQ